MLFWLVLVLGGWSMELNETALGSFLDAYFTNQRQLDMGWAAVGLSIFNATHTVFRGYGSSKAVTSMSTPVTPQSVFSLASISKTFVGVATSLLFGEAEMDQSEINSLLESDEQVRDVLFDGRAASPIRIKHLVTHSAGLDENFITRNALFGEPVLSLKEDLKKNFPKRVWDVGQVSTYSNFGTAMAGRLCERRSGMEYGAFVKSRIWDPLQMNNTFYTYNRAKLSPHFVEMAYFRKTDATHGQYREFPINMQDTNAQPSAAAYSNHEDMTRYAQMLLKNGAPILDSSQFSRLFASRWNVSDSLPSIGTFFYQDLVEGVLYVGHDGDLNPFHSLLRLSLSDGIGVFLTVSGSSGRPSTFLPHFTHQFLKPSNYCSSIGGVSNDNFNTMPCIMKYPTLDVVPFRRDPAAVSGKYSTVESKCYMDTRRIHTGWLSAVYKLNSGVVCFSTANDFLASGNAVIFADNGTSPVAKDFTVMQKNDSTWLTLPESGGAMAAFSNGFFYQSFAFVSKELFGSVAEYNALVDNFIAYVLGLQLLFVFVLTGAYLSCCGCVCLRLVTCLFGVFRFREKPTKEVALDKPVELTTEKSQPTTPKKSNACASFLASHLIFFVHFGVMAVAFALYLLSLILCMVVWLLSLLSTNDLTLHDSLPSAKAAAIVFGVISILLFIIAFIILAGYFLLRKAWPMIVKPATVAEWVVIGLQVPLALLYIVSLIVILSWAIGYLDAMGI